MNEPSSSPFTPTASIPSPSSPTEPSRCGAFKFKRRQIFLSQALSEEWIAFEEVADGVWSLHFYDVLLGRLDERDFKLRT